MPHVNGYAISFLIVRAILYVCYWSRRTNFSDKILEPSQWFARFKLKCTRRHFHTEAWVVVTFNSVKANPVRTQRCFNVYTTFITLRRRCMDVKMTVSIYYYRCYSFYLFDKFAMLNVLKTKAEAFRKKKKKTFPKSFCFYF